MNETTHSHNKPQHHININPKLKSIKANSQKWKEDLRNECLQRAKASRKEIFLRRRCLDRHNGLYNNAPALIGSQVKRDIMECYDLGQFKEDHACFKAIDSDHPLEKDEFVRLRAKALVEQVVHSSMIHGLPDHKFLADQTSVEDGNFDAELISWSEHLAEEFNGQSHAKRDDERKMSEMDYYELLNDVAQKLQEEGKVILV